MKTIKVILFLFAFTIIEANSQSFSISVQPGLVAANEFAYYTGKSNLMDNSFRFIVTSILYIPSNFSLNTFACYEFKNGNRISIEPGFIRKGIWRDEYFYYIQSPVIFNFYLPKKETSWFSIGFDYAYMLAATTGYTKRSIHNNLSSIDSRHEVSFIIGSEYSLSQRWEIGIRFCQGLIPFIQEDEWTVVGYPHNYVLSGEKINHYNRCMQLTLRYNILRKDLSKNDISDN